MQHTSGPVWALDYFDRFVRNEDQLGLVIEYIETNPVKAGLVTTPQDWPFSSAILRNQADLPRLA